MEPASNGMRSLSLILERFELSECSWLQIVHAREAALLGSENGVGQVVGVERRLPWRAPLPTEPVLLLDLSGPDVATGVKHWLSQYYPADHSLRLLARGVLSSLALNALDTVDLSDSEAALLVPALPEIDDVRTFSGIMNLTRTLRAPGGCPWDREQTRATVRPHLLEEVYEVLDAIESGDPAAIAEELGDLLYQITIHSQIAAEDGEFTIANVIQSIVCKLIGRHPHVFGDLELDTAHDVLQAWEKFKQREKPKRASVLEEIPRGLPALLQSNLIQKRVANVGFPWPDEHDVTARIREGVAELELGAHSRNGTDRQSGELGEILFSLVSLARYLKIEPEEALRLANRRFQERFQYLEAELSAQKMTFRDMPPDELRALWGEAKKR